MPMLRNATGRATTTAARSNTACTRASRGQRWVCVRDPLTTTCSISSLMTMAFSLRDGVRVYGGDGGVRVMGYWLLVIGSESLTTYDLRPVVPNFRLPD